MKTLTKLLLWGTTALVSLPLAGCCNLLDRGSGDDSEQLQGPDPVTGALPPPRNGFLADLRFRPTTNGFKFENGGNAAYPRTPGFVNAPEMVRLFGAKDVCIGGRLVGKTCRMTPAAAEFARQVNRSMNGGQCEGMAVASLTFFRGIDQITQFSPGARSAHDVNREQVRGLIGYYFAYQFSDPVIAAKIDAKRRYTPVQTMERVIDLINKGDPGVLFMRSPDNMSGHAVSPYAVEDRGNGIYWIRIYDNNWPNKERFVEVDKNANTWKYELAAINPGVAKMPWAGSATSYTFGVVPISVRQQKIVCPFCRKTRTRGIMGDSTVISNMTITDDQGRTATVQNGEPKSDIPGVTITPIDVWIDGQPGTEFLYTVPEDTDVDIDMEGKESATAGGEVVIFGGGTAVTIENVKIAPKQKDRVSLSADGSGIRYKPAGKGKIPPMKVAMDDDEDGYVVQVSNVDHDDDDDDDDNNKGFVLKMDKGAGKVQVFGAGKKANKSYDLKMTRVKADEKDDEVAEVKGNKFGKAGEAHTISLKGMAKGKPIKLEKAVVKVKPKIGGLKPRVDIKKDPKAADAKDPKAADVKKPVIIIKPKDDKKPAPPPAKIKLKK